MRRIDTPTKAVDLFGAGKHGFKNGDPALAILATKLNAEFFNSVQEELSRAIEGAGFALSPSDNTQLLSAITTLARGVLPKRSFAASDYIRIPDVSGGLILQWGTVTLTGVSAAAVLNGTINYPLAFPNAALCVVATTQDTANSEAYGSTTAIPVTINVSAAQSSFSYNLRAPTVTMANNKLFRWIAIGY